jgi:hypothetical protein
MESGYLKEKTLIKTNNNTRRREGGGRGEGVQYGNNKKGAYMDVVYKGFFCKSADLLKRGCLS